LAANVALIILEAAVLLVVFRRFGVKIDFYPYMALGLAECFLAGINIIPLRYYRMEFQSRKYAAATISNAIIFHSISVYLIRFLGMGAEGRLMGAAGAALIMAVFYLTTMPSHAETIIDLSIIKKGLRFSLPLMLGAYSVIALSISDRIILERFVPVADIGIYSVSHAIASAATLLIASFFFVIEPLAYKISSTSNFASEFTKLKRYFFFVVFVIVAILVLWAQEACMIFLPERFASGAAILIPIMAMSSMFIASRDILGLLLMIENKTAVISGITALAALASLILNLALVPVWGIYASAWAGVVAYALSAAFSYAMTSGSSKKFAIKNFAASVLLIATLIALSRALAAGDIYRRISLKFLISAATAIFLIKNYSINLRTLVSLFPLPALLRKKTSAP
jgi:O-antigen/teichoic acid export membrane protein